MRATCAIYIVFHDSSTLLVSLLVCIPLPTFLCYLSFNEKNKPHFPLTSGTFLMLPTHFELCSVRLTSYPPSFGVVYVHSGYNKEYRTLIPSICSRPLKQKMGKSYLPVMWSHLPQYVCKSLQPSSVTMAMKRMRPYFLPRDQFSSRDIF
jgi:hypothetical protein